MFWSVVLTGGLLLVGLDVYQGRERRAASPTGSEGGVTATSMEDGTGFPPPR
jgi:hypothetical protein